MNCPKCGRVCPLEANFCARCGAELEHDNVTFDEEPKITLRPSSANPMRKEKVAPSPFVPPKETERKPFSPLYQEDMPLETGVLSPYQRPVPEEAAPQSGPEAQEMQEETIAWMASQPTRPLPDVREIAEAEEDDDEDEGFGLFEKDDDEFDDEPVRPKKEKPEAPRRKPLPDPKRTASHIRPVSEDKPLGADSEQDVFLFDDEMLEEEEEEHSGHTFKLVGLLTLCLLILLGVLFFKESDAGRRLQAMTGLFADSEDYVLLGNSYIEDGKYSQAAEVYLKAFKCKPDDYQMDLDIAEALRRCGDYNNTKKIYEYVLDHWPDKREALQRLLAMYKESDNQQEYDRLIEKYGLTEDGQFPEDQAEPVSAPAGAAQGAWAAPEANIPSDTYENGVRVALTSPAGGSIYYTLDGSDPDESANLYTGFIIMDEEKTYHLRAAAVKDGVIGAIFDARYTITKP